MKQCYRFAIFFWVFKIAIDRRRAAFQSGFELWQIADKDDKLWIKIRFATEAQRLRVFFLTSLCLCVSVAFIKNPTLWLYTKLFQLSHDFATQTIEFADGQ